MDPQEVVRECTGRSHISFAHFPVMVAPCITMYNGQCKEMVLDKFTEFIQVFLIIQVPLCVCE